MKLVTRLKVSRRGACEIWAVICVISLPDLAVLSLFLARKLVIKFVDIGMAPGPLEPRHGSIRVHWIHDVESQIPSTQKVLLIDRDRNSCPVSDVTDAGNLAQQGGGPAIQESGDAE